MKWSRNAMISPLVATMTSLTAPRLHSCVFGRVDSSDSHQMNLNRPSTSKATVVADTIKDKVNGYRQVPV